MTTQDQDLVHALPTPTAPAALPAACFSCGLLLVAMSKGHGCAVSRGAFSLDGKILASASGDRTIRLWPISREELAITDWRAQAAKEEARYGLKLEGISLVPWTPPNTGDKP